MRKIRFLLLCICLKSVYAQDITHIEYFIDNDSGYGNGTPVSFTQGNDITVNFLVTLPGSMPEGFHFLGIRAKDANNKWSTVGIRPFYNQYLPENALADIVEMEYFIDNDPGYGNGTHVSFIADSSIAQNFQISMPPNLSEGFHFLSIRAKDTRNTWSIVSTRPFFKQTIPDSSLLNIVAVEYFIDTDPGLGNATSIPIMAGTSVTRDFLLELVGLSNGNHLLYIRAKDQSNRWSQLSMREFTVQDNIIIIQNMTDEWCASENFNIPVVLYGTYAEGNVFTAQLSDATGSFASPITIGMVSSTTAVTITGNIPDTVSVGNNYKIRVVSSNPLVENSPVKPFELVSVCPPPCASIRTLQSWDDDYVGEHVIIETNETDGSISASNQVRNNANVIYRSGRSIILNPGFSVNSGAVFKTEFGGCN